MFPLAAVISATACPSVSVFEGRPANCPFGVSTNVATLVDTRSSGSACRIARTSTLCVTCTVRVDDREPVQKAGNTIGPRGSSVLGNG
jgi:hypothetical protein